MTTNVPPAEAKARLSELVYQAGAGEEVYITRRGKVVAKIVAADRRLSGSISICCRRPLRTSRIRAKVLEA